MICYNNVNDSGPLTCEVTGHLKGLRPIATESTPQWKDGDTFLNNDDDRLGILLVGIFAALLARYIVPELLRHVRSI